MPVKKEFASDGARPGESLLFEPPMSKRSQLEDMNNLQSTGPYRVRVKHANEQAVPLEVDSPRFTSMESANRYAVTLDAFEQCCVIIEKLAPGGCWLQLSCL